MKSLKWSQVNAWRLAQHGLSPPLKRKKIVEAVRRTGGIQAQLMSAAEMAIGVRIEGLTPQDVRHPAPAPLRGYPALRRGAQHR